jgi:hypothetical protein
MTTDIPPDQAEHNRRTREAYDRLAPVWSATGELAGVVGVPVFIARRLWLRL